MPNPKIFPPLTKLNSSQPGIKGDPPLSHPKTRTVHPQPHLIASNEKSKSNSLNPSIGQDRPWLPRRHSYLQRSFRRSAKARPSSCKQQTPTRGFTLSSSKKFSALILLISSTSTTTKL